MGQNEATFPLPWERILWRAVPRAPLRFLARKPPVYAVTDFRIVELRGENVTAELALDDIESVQYRRRWWQPLVGAADLLIRSRRPADDLVLSSIQPSDYLLWLIEMLRHGIALDEEGQPEPDYADELPDIDVGRPGRFGPRWASLVLGPGLVACALVVIAIILHGRELTPQYRRDDAIYPGGQKKSREEILRFMRAEVMPFAKKALGPIKSGAARVTCYTCHGQNAEARDWSMPAVEVVPEPELRRAGLERYARTTDPELRNAVYGYLAREDKQDVAAYMRDVVMPGMAVLLRRPAYDFTQSYAYNRSRSAFGCYHCHKIS